MIYTGEENSLLQRIKKQRAQKKQEIYHMVDLVDDQWVTGFDVPEVIVHFLASFLGGSQLIHAIATRK